MAVLKRARIESAGHLFPVLALALELAAFAACTSFRQHSDISPDGGAGASGIGGSGGFTGGSGGRGGATGASGASGGSTGGGGGQGGSGGMALKPDGEPCSAAAECAGGICGGRCYVAGCTCTLPSPANLLKDPGFDVDVSNWTTSTGTIMRALFDAERCPYSGSLAATADSAQSVTQCVPNTPLFGDFVFGGAFRIDSNGPSAPPPICQSSFYSGFNCDADVIVTNETDPPAAGGTWRSISGVVPNVTGANSVAFNCYLGSTTGVTYYLDMLYLSKAPGGF